MSKRPPGDPMSLTARAGVLTTLALPAIQKVDFQLSVFAITPKLFRAVSDAIKDNRIHVVYDSDLTDTAYYYETPVNEIELGYATPTTSAHQELIVHEWAHAGFDILNYDNDKLTDTVAHEAIAYIAAYMFGIAQEHLAKRIDPYRANINPADMTTLQFALASTALTFYRGHGSSISVNARLEELEQEIKAHPKYSSTVEAEEAQRRSPAVPPASVRQGSAAFQGAMETAAVSKSADKPRRRIRKGSKAFKLRFN